MSDATKKLFSVEISIIEVAGQRPGQVPIPVPADHFLVKVNIVVGITPPKGDPDGAGTGTPAPAFVQCKIVIPGVTMPQCTDGPVSKLPASGTQERCVTVPTPSLADWPSGEVTLSAHLFDVGGQTELCGPSGAVQLVRASASKTV